MKPSPQCGAKQRMFPGTQPWRFTPPLGDEGSSADPSADPSALLCSLAAKKELAQQRFSVTDPCAFCSGWGCSERGNFKRGVIQRYWLSLQRFSYGLEGWAEVIAFKLKAGFVHSRGMSAQSSLPARKQALDAQSRAESPQPRVSQLCPSAGLLRAPQTCWGGDILHSEQLLAMGEGQKPGEGTQS